MCSLKIAQELGLSSDEYKMIIDYMGRTPNFTELSIYSVMWSEHCSYKNSIKYLKTLPRDGSKLMVEAGEENAGLVDIGDGLACAFKIESHNHPSAIEPYQGAATGVGGIHRDIFTMGARPIGALNSLRFGELESKHTRRLVTGVVAGIGDYGNCLGVPTVGGEVYFDACYNQNILVNAMSVGIVKHGETVSAIAEGLGNPVLIVGSATGKDGIHGATFASADLTEDSADDLPAVQVGDPFQEKLLLEASLEAIKTGAMVGMQDMGAAGIICSTSEMSAKGKVGMRIDLNKVPTRQANMKAFEILLSESQERMLIVAYAGREQELFDVFEKWDLECEQIGEVTDTGQLEFLYHGEVVAEVNANSLVLGGGAPVYQREISEPSYFKNNQHFSIDQISIPSDLKQVARQIISHPSVASKKWIFEQYDSMVRTNTTTTNEPSAASIIRLKNSEKCLVVTTDCNSAYVYADPYKGAMIAVSEAARNIICSGGEPMAITNCLNFGNPYDPEVYWQFSQAIKGMGDACRKFDTPVTGGNVSFYNQSVIKNETTPVYPTPTIGMMGILNNENEKIGLSFKNVADTIILIGKSQNDVNQSIYLKSIHQITDSGCPYFDLEEEYKLHQSVKKLAKLKLIQSANDISEGGLFTSLFESTRLNKLGFNIATDGTYRTDAYLFGESQGRVVISVNQDSVKNVIKILDDQQQAYCVLGSCQKDIILINNENWGEVDYWNELYETTLTQAFKN